MLFLVFVFLRCNDFIGVVTQFTEKTERENNRDLSGE